MGRLEAKNFWSSVHLSPVSRSAYPVSKLNLLQVQLVQRCCCHKTMTQLLFCLRLVQALRRCVRTFAYSLPTKREQTLTGPESSKVWPGFSWAFPTRNPYCTTTRTSSSRQSIQTISVTIMPSHASRRTRLDRKCISRHELLSMLRIFGIYCKIKSRTSTCVA